MKQEAIDRFVRFAEDRKADIGFTHSDAAHDYVSGVAIQILNDLTPLVGKNVLDIGCGKGRDLLRFNELGANPTGLTLHITQQLTDTGIPVIFEDQAFSTIPDAAYDVIFARHVLEHAIAPFYAVCEYARFLKMDGTAYVEVPACGQKAQQELNANHYGVMPELMWYNFFTRAGFDIVKRVDAPVDLYDKDGNLIKGADLWWGFFLQKKRDFIISHDDWAKMIKSSNLLEIKVK